MAEGAAGEEKGEPTLRERVKRVEQKARGRSGHQQRGYLGVADDDAGGGVGGLEAHELGEGQGLGPDAGGRPLPGPLHPTARAQDQGGG